MHTQSSRNMSWVKNDVLRLIAYILLAVAILFLLGGRSAGWIGSAPADEPIAMMQID